MARSPLRSEVIVMFNEVIRDQYQDVVSTEIIRVKKWGVVSKSVDLDYVQQLGGDILVEDTDSLPWAISMTLTDLPRIPKMDDQVLIEGKKYTISAVRPMNRDLPSVIVLFVYPERSTVDDLMIYEVTPKVGFRGVKYLDVLYGGNPEEYSFDGEHWFDFESRIAYEEEPSTLYVRDRQIQVKSDIPVRGKDS